MLRLNPHKAEADLERFIDLGHLKCIEATKIAFEPNLVKRLDLVQEYS
jgi:hypothetical protein